MSNNPFFDGHGITGASEPGFPVKSNDKKTVTWETIEQIKETAIGRMHVEKVKHMVKCMFPDMPVVKNKS